METPVYKLEGVLRQHDDEAAQDFEGPLDLILFLLGKNKLEIQDVSISLIVDQYLAYLEERKHLDLEIASEFVSMAAQLMFIKTRMLLSIEDEEAQSEMDALLRSLEERRARETYARVKVLAAQLEPMEEFGRSIVTRDPESMQRGKIVTYDHQPTALLAALRAISERGERTAPPRQEVFREIVGQKPYPVSDKAGELLRRLKTAGITRFLALFHGSRSRSEIVATFLAVLELCRASVIRLAGGETDCVVDCPPDAPDEFVM